LNQLAYGDLLNIAVWVKNNGGQGSFNRSQHEFIAVLRVGDGAHADYRTAAVDCYGRDCSLLTDTFQSAPIACIIAGSETFYIPTASR
jgi:hypothetical protein